MSGYDISSTSQSTHISALPYINAIVLTDSRRKIDQLLPLLADPERESSRSRPLRSIQVRPTADFFGGQACAAVRLPETGYVSIARKFTGPNGEFLGEVIGVVDVAVP